MYELVELDENDRTELGAMMEKDIDEQPTISGELNRMGAENRFLKRPLMVKSLIQLMVDKRVNMKKIKNSAELYLMMLMKNLEFHEDTNTNFTELEPIEDHEHLQM